MSQADYGGGGPEPETCRKLKQALTELAAQGVPMTDQVWYLGDSAGKLWDFPVPAQASAEWHNRIEQMAASAVRTSSPAPEAPFTSPSREEAPTLFITEYDPKTKQTHHRKARTRAVDPRRPGSGLGDGGGGAA